MKNLEAKLKEAIFAMYPEAVILAYYWTTGEMIFNPSPDDDKCGSCVYRDGKYVINWDF